MDTMEASRLEPTVTGPPGNGIDATKWKQLRFLSLYRVVLTVVLAVLFFASPEAKLLGGNVPQLYGITVSIYFLFSLVCVVGTFQAQIQFEDQVIIQIIADIVLVTFLMHASGGVFSGLGAILVVALAGGGLLLPGQMAYAFAAMASVAVLGETAFLAQSRGSIWWMELGHAGVLGAAFFATAAMAHLLGQRTKESEALAARQEVDLADLTELNEYVIQRMATGIMVVDSHQKIRLFNATAADLLALPATANGRPLAQASPELQQRLGRWHERPDEPVAPFRADPSMPDILPRFQSLGASRDTGTVISLEDTAQLAMQAQQMKLAALGRLTAGIAHEIRNPLGAISHAGQLLAESPRLEPGDHRMTEIIQTQCQRVNTVVENVLQLSRPQAAQLQELSLHPWAEAFAAEFRNLEKLEDKQISVTVTPRELQVRFDPGHLHQITWNLCTNALQHADPKHGPVRLELRGGLTQTGRPYLEIGDNGVPITPEVQQGLFEPFYTTTVRGTGLGLYIARELCEHNQARLEYRFDLATGKGFRISFARS